MLRLDHAARRERHGRGQRLLQLTHVQRPSIAEQEPGRLAAELDALAAVRRGPAQQRGQQDAEVLAAAAQGRKREREAADPRVQIGAELAPLDQGLQVPVGGGDQPEVHLDRLGAADGKHLGLLQSAQQRRLAGAGQIGHLVEEEGPAVGGADQAWPVLAGAGEGPPAVPEQLRLHQRSRNRPAVHRHESPGPPGELVDGARGQLLAAAALARDDHRHRRPGDQLQPFELRGEPAGERRQARRGRLELRGVDVRAIARDRHRVPEDEEGVAQFEGIALRQERGLARDPVDERPVPRPGVLEEPAGRRPRKAGVLSRHPGILDGEREDALSVLVDALATALAAPADADRVLLRQRMTGRRGERLLAVQREEEVWRRRPDGAAHLGRGRKRVDR